MESQVAAPSREHHHHFDSCLIPIRHFFSSPLMNNNANDDNRNKCVLGIVTHLDFVAANNSSSKIPSYFYYFVIEDYSAKSQNRMGKVYRIHLPSSSAAEGCVENLGKSIDLSGGLRQRHFIADPKSAYFYCMANKKVAEADKEEEQGKERHQEQVATTSSSASSAFVPKLVRFSVTTLRRQSLPILGGDTIPDEASGEQAFLSEHLKFIGPECLLFVRTENSHPELWPPLFGRFDRICYSSIVFLLRVDEMHKCVVPTKIWLPDLPSRFLEPGQEQGQIDRRLLYLDWTIRSSTFVCGCEQQQQQNEQVQNCTCYHFPASSVEGADSPAGAAGADSSSASAVGEGNTKLLRMMQKCCLFNLDMSSQLVVYNWHTGIWDKFQLNRAKNHKPMDDPLIFDFPVCIDYGFCAFLEANEWGKDSILYRLNIDAQNAEYWFTAVFKCGDTAPCLYIDNIGHKILNWEWLNNFVEIVLIGRLPSLKSMAFWKSIAKKEKNKTMKKLVGENIGTNVDMFVDQIITLINMDDGNNDDGLVRIVPTKAQIYDYLKESTANKIE